MRRKGLIAREFLLSKKNRLLFLAIWGSIALLAILMRLSMLYGNLQSVASDPETVSTIFGVSFWIPPLLLFTQVANMDAIDADIASGWSVFRYTTPQTDRMVARLRLSIEIAILGVTFLVNLLYGLLVYSMYDKPVTKWLPLGITALALATVCCNAFASNGLYRLRSKKRLSVRIAIVVSVLYGAFTVGTMIAVSLFEKYQETHPDMDFEHYMQELLPCLEQKLQPFVDLLPFLLPLALVAALRLGYMRAVKLLQRRDF